jgi:hypothetical protein
LRAAHPLFGNQAEGEELLEEIAASRIVVRGYMQQYDLEHLGVSKAAATVDNIEAAGDSDHLRRLPRLLPAHFAAQWIKTGDMHRWRPPVCS